MDRLAYRPDEAAKMIGVSKTTLYKLIGEGRIATFKAATCTLITHEELARFIQAAQGERTGYGRFMESGPR